MIPARGAKVILAVHCAIGGTTGLSMSGAGCGGKFLKLESIIMKECPCKSCEGRKYLAIAFDIHVWGRDCPYPCKRYEEWKEKQDENR